MQVRILQRADKIGRKCAWHTHYTEDASVDNSVRNWEWGGRKQLRTTESSLFHNFRMPFHPFSEFLISAMWKLKCWQKLKLMAKREKRSERFRSWGSCARNASSQNRQQRSARLWPSVSSCFREWRAKTFSPRTQVCSLHSCNWERPYVWCGSHNPLNVRGSHDPLWGPVDHKTMERD